MPATAETIREKLLVIVVNDRVPPVVTVSWPTLLSPQRLAMTNGSKNRFVITIKSDSTPAAWASDHAHPQHRSSFCKAVRHHRCPWPSRFASRSTGVLCL